MNFSSQGKQLCIDDFKSSLEGLNKSNRWVRLGDTLPRDEIEKLYNQRLNNGKRGAGNKSARMIVGALVIKHKMNLSDEETILAILNMYHRQEQMFKEGQPCLRPSYRQHLSTACPPHCPG